MLKSSKSDKTTSEARQSEPKKKLTFQMEVDQDFAELGQVRIEGQDTHREICMSYDGIVEIAESFVEKMLAEASEQINSLRDVNRLPKLKNVDNKEVTDEDDVTEASISMRTFTESFDNINLWPSIQDFTVNAGLEAIVDYISNWFYKEDWTYDIKLVLLQSDDCSDYYTYEVKWGIPTKSYPIPQATASVFFILDVSRVKPPECQIGVGHSIFKVTYQFEGCSYKHEPFKHTFKEQWLFSIIEMKLRFFQSLKF